MNKIFYIVLFQKALPKGVVLITNECFIVTFYCTKVYIFRFID